MLRLESQLLKGNLTISNQPGLTIGILQRNPLYSKNSYRKIPLRCSFAGIHQSHKFTESHLRDAKLWQSWPIKKFHHNQENL